MSNIIEKKEVILLQVVKLSGSGNMCFYYTDSDPGMKRYSIYVKTSSEYEKVLKTFPKSNVKFRMNFREGGSLLFDSSTINYTIVVDNEKSKILAIGKREGHTVTSLEDFKQYCTYKFIEEARKLKYKEAISTLEDYSSFIRRLAILLDNLQKEMY